MTESQRKYFERIQDITAACPTCKTPFSVKTGADPAVRHEHGVLAARCPSCSGTFVMSPGLFDGTWGWTKLQHEGPGTMTDVITEMDLDESRAELLEFLDKLAKRGFCERPKDTDLPTIFKAWTSIMGALRGPTP